MIQTSPSTGKLDAALAKAQGAFKAAQKDGFNPHFKSSYADLASVWGACRDALAAVGISTTQWLVHADDNRLHIVTRLACEGEWMMAEWSMPVSKQDPQGYGSAATYARRYALAAAVGVVADEDDDANAASEAPKRTAKREPKVDVDGWKLRVDLAASLGTEELNKLRPDFNALPEGEGKEKVRTFLNAARSSATRAAAERIASGQSPEAA